MADSVTHSEGIISDQATCRLIDEAPGRLLQNSVAHAVVHTVFTQF